MEELLIKAVWIGYKWLINLFLVLEYKKEETVNI